MARSILIASVAAVMLSWLPVQAQESVPELAGGPGSHRAPPPAPAAKPVPQAPSNQVKQAKTDADKLKADRARLAQQASAEAAEDVRLAKKAEDLKAQQDRLDGRARELAAEEKRLAQAKADQEAEHAAKLAEIAHQKEEVEQVAALGRKQAQQNEANVILPPRPTATPAPDSETALDVGRDDQDVAGRGRTTRATPTHLDLDAAERSCARAGADAALARDYDSARYDAAPRLYQGRGIELRGRMRLEDRRGYLLIDTICELGEDGEAQHFAFLR